MLRITLLGAPQLQLANLILSKEITGRALALLAYLVVTNRPQTRSLLADLLWNDVTEHQARKNLRYVIYDLRQVLGDYLIVSRQTVAFNSGNPYWLDVEVFSTFLESDQSPANTELLQDVLNLYQVEFLDGFYIQDAPIFDTWMAAQRQKLHTQAVHGLQLLAQQYLNQQKYMAGILTTQRILSLEPWNEDAHRQQMCLFAYAGHHSAALTQYEVCRQALLEEFDTEPLYETDQLYTAIKAGQFRRTTPQQKPDLHTNPEKYTTLRNHPWLRIVHKAEGESSQPALVVNWDAIPMAHQLTGREQELVRLDQWICVDRCRLISISGIGGHGKSALVAELVRRISDQMEEPEVEHPQSIHSSHPTNHLSRIPFVRIFWCSLTGVASFAQLMAYWWRWCDALAGFTDTERMEDDIPLEEQLTYMLFYLQQQRCLLILDQVESILQPGKFAGVYQPGWENFSEFLRRIADSQHTSCLVLIGREEPADLTFLATNTSAVRTLSLLGLTREDGVAMLRNRGFTEQTNDLASLVQQYDGLPLALTYLSVLRQRLPTLQLATLFSQETLFIEEVRKQFAQQFARLSPIEYDLLLWLTIERGNVTFDYFWQHCTVTTQKNLLLDAHQSLLRRGLLHIEPQGQNVTLSKMVLRYTTQQLIDLIVTEIFTAWEMKAQRQSIVRPTHRPLRTAVDYPARYRHSSRGANGPAELSTAPNPGMQKEQASFLPVQSWVEAGDVMQARVERTDHSPPFVYLNRYRLVHTKATDAIADEQHRLLLLPLVRRLLARWSLEGTCRRLDALLDGLTQEPYADGATAEYNLLALLAACKIEEELMRSQDTVGDVGDRVSLAQRY
jgi:DNA-binding SARP family transcriptional activator